MLFHLSLVIGLLCAHESSYLSSETNRGKLEALFACRSAWAALSRGIPRSPVLQAEDIDGVFDQYSSDTGDVIFLGEGEDRIAYAVGPLGWSLSSLEYNGSPQRLVESVAVIVDRRA